MADHGEAVESKAIRRGGESRSLAQMRAQERLDLAEITVLELAAVTDGLTITGLREDAITDEATITKLRDAAAGDALAMAGLRAEASDARAVILALQGDVRNLEAALLSSRRIGGAIGVLMSTRRLTESQAFEALVTCSQQTNRKVRELADEVLLTGALPVTPPHA